MTSACATDVMIGASVPVGLDQIKMFEALKLGDCVLTWLPMDMAEALELASYCRAQKITLYFSEWLRRGSVDVVRRSLTDGCNSKSTFLPIEDFYSKAELERIMDTAGSYYGGRMAMGEASGLLYLPRQYLDRPGGDWKLLPEVETVDQAKQNFVECLRSLLQAERQRLGRGPLVSVDPSMGQKYLAEAGWDVLGVEIHPSDAHMAHAATRGAARAYGLPWGVHIAMQWYGGIEVDQLWLKRWRTSLDYAYIAGANFIWPESGHYSYQREGAPPLEFNSTPMKQARRILRETCRFARLHNRPIGGPRRGIGIVHGHLDGAPNTWTRVVWGQHHDAKWHYGPAEQGWNFLEQIHRRETWTNTNLAGERDFSGSPPFGQYDIVPAEASLEQLAQYRALVFLGWNTMTESLYKKLKEYVELGGRLVMYLPQLSTHTDRAASFQLLRDGDFRDLFGVHITGQYESDLVGLKSEPKTPPVYRFASWGKITDPRFMGHMSTAKVELDGAQVIFGVHTGVIFDGVENGLDQRPLLVENRIGDGAALLVTAWHYPGDAAISKFTRELLRTVLAGEQGDIRLLGPDYIRYAVYDYPSGGPNNDSRVVYLLNTDPDVAGDVQLHIDGFESPAIHIAANSMRLIFCCGQVTVSPQDRRVDLRKWVVESDRDVIWLTNETDQDVELQVSASDAREVEINGMRLRCEPGHSQSLCIPRQVNPQRMPDFDEDFIEGELPTQCTNMKTPY